MPLIFVISAILSWTALTLSVLANRNLRRVVARQREAMVKQTVAMEAQTEAIKAQERQIEAYKEHIDLLNLLNPVSIKKGDLN